MLKPITPAEVRTGTNKPAEVFESFNELIAKHWDGTGASFTTLEAAQMIAQKMDITPTDVVKNHYLDVENAYKKAGWDVYFDRPGYSENYEAAFAFVPTVHFGEGA